MDNKEINAANTFDNTDNKSVTNSVTAEKEKIIQPKKETKKVTKVEHANVDTAVIERVAFEVSCGQYGTGDALNNALVRMGLDPAEVIKRVKKY